MHACEQELDDVPFFYHLHDMSRSVVAHTALDLSLALTSALCSASAFGPAEGGFGQDAACDGADTQRDPLGTAERRLPRIDVAHCSSALQQRRATARARFSVFLL